MSRTEKITKLANAIRDYRGAYDASSGAWILPPKIYAVSRVRVWLDRLGLDSCENVKAIEGFHNFNEFNDWIKSLYEAKP